MAAIGDVDEANCAIGLAIAALGDGPLAADLRLVQNELFDLGADLATPGEVEGALRVVPDQVERLEKRIDILNAELAPLNSFILPGGSEAAARLHVARAIVRRAERLVVALKAGEAVNGHALAYLNRLSDHLFVAARWTAAQEGGDVLWRPGATRDPG